MVCVERMESKQQRKSTRYHNMLVLPGLGPLS